MPPWLTHPPTTVKRDACSPTPFCPSKRAWLFAPALWVWDVGWGPGNASLTWRRNHGSDHTLRISSWPRAWLLCQIPHSPGLLLNTDKEFSCPSAHPTLSCPSAHRTHQVHPSCSPSDPALSGLRRAPPPEEGARHPKKPFQHLRIRGEL